LQEFRHAKEKTVGEISGERTFALPLAIDAA
jgi:hypothetical protein